MEFLTKNDLIKAIVQFEEENGLWQECYEFAKKNPIDIYHYYVDNTGIVEEKIPMYVDRYVELDNYGNIEWERYKLFRADLDSKKIQKGLKLSDVESIISENEMYALRPMYATFKERMKNLLKMNIRDLNDKIIDIEEKLKIIG